MSAPVATPIPYTEADLAVISYNEAGLVPAIIQEEGTNDVLMVAWMNEDTLRETLDTGRTVFLEPQPPGAVAQGRHVR